MNERSGQSVRSILGEDPHLERVLTLVRQVAATVAPVLITGESGTGKELVAREIHDRSGRRGPFVALNCGALASNLEESELFGHLPGAFTGALGRKQGKLEAAHGGTLFLDEVAEMSPAVQVKLLRFLEGGEYSPVGMAETRRCDVRVVAATNQRLERLLRKGTFRPELYYRLNVVRVELPPLRARRGDILLLARHFAAGFAALYGRGVPVLDPALETCLLHYSYPGNVRELKNAIHRAVILACGGPLTVALLPPEMVAPPAEPVAAPAASFHDAKRSVVERFEREYLTAMLRESGGIVSRAASCSGLSERNFHEKLSRYGIDGRSFRAPWRH